MDVGWMELKNKFSDNLISVDLFVYFDNFQHAQSTVFLKFKMLAKQQFAHYFLKYCMRDFLV
jgi:hypothetical protein